MSSSYYWPLIGSNTSVPASSGVIFPQQRTPTPSATAPTVGRVQEIVEAFTLAADGDAYEKHYWARFSQRFQNYERFWKYLVVPTTSRLDLALGFPGRHERREGIGDDVWRVTYQHYSAFLHLGYAWDHLSLQQHSSVCDFYAHVGTALDLVEGFLCAVFKLICECRGIADPYHPELDEEIFIDKMRALFQKRHETWHANYLSKGKSFPVYVPCRGSILKSYFGKGDAAWKAYDQCQSDIRSYRNRLVHDVAVPVILLPPGNRPHIPRKETIKEYGNMRLVQEAANDTDLFERDFIFAPEQMHADFEQVQTVLNGLWEKPIGDLRSLLYTEGNEILRKKLHLS